MNVVYPAGPGPKRDQQNEKDYEHQNEDHQGPEGHPDHAEAQRLTLSTPTPGLEVTKPTEEARQEQMNRPDEAEGWRQEAQGLGEGSEKARQGRPGRRPLRLPNPRRRRPPRPPNRPRPRRKPKAAGTSKKDQVLALISRKNGASLDEIMTATGWQKHTVRGFIAILGKKGTKIESFKSEAGARTYKA